MSNCNETSKIKRAFLIKTPPKVKSNPLGIKGEHMGVFFKQKLTKEVFEQAIKTEHIILV